MVKFLDIIKQQYKIEDYDKEIANCERKIKVQKNEQKSYKRWAILPPVIILSMMILGGLTIDAVFNSVDNESLVTMMGASKFGFLFPLAVSLGFPLFYGHKLRESNKIIDNEIERKRSLEEEKSLNESILKKMELERKEEDYKDYDEERNRFDLLNNFFASKKEYLIEIYKNGKMSSLELMGWTISDIVYLQGLIEDEINWQNTHNLNKEQGMQRVRVHKN